MNRVARSVVIVLFSPLFILDGCDHWPVPPSSIRVEKGPAFLLSGRGKLATLTIHAPPKGSRIADPNPFDQSSVIWELECEHGLLMGADLEGLRVVYGSVPDRCQQTVPRAPQSPPLLASGQVYYFHVWSSLAGGLGGDFYVDKSGAIVPVDVDNCSTKDSGRWVRVNCKTGERFVEPIDIDAFARAHTRKCAFKPVEPTGSSFCDQDASK